jgi:protein-tyrosine phosphatase
MILDYNEIIEGRLWVGCFVRTDEVRILRQLGITTVFNLQSDRDLNDYGISIIQLAKAYAFADIELRRIPIPDFDKQALAAGLSNAVEELENALARNEAKVYVHCTAGINRGPTLAAAYLMKAGGLSAQDAYEYVISRRHCNPYLDTLQAYEASLP